MRNSTSILISIIFTLINLGAKAEITDSNNPYNHNKSNTPTSINCYLSPEHKIMQTFYIDVHKNTVWLTYDNEKRNHQIIETYDKNKNLLDRQDYSGESSIGHLDGIYIDDDIIYTTDKYTNPSIIKLKNKKIISRLQYPKKVIGNQVLAIDRNKKNNFILWATEDKSKNKIIYVGKFDKENENIKNLYISKIVYPQSVVLQGLVLSNDTAYALTGSPNAPVILYSWNISSGDLIEKNILNFNLDKFGDNLKYEPEGLNIITDKNNKKKLLIGLTINTTQNKTFNCIVTYSNY